MATKSNTLYVITLCVLALPLTACDLAKKGPGSTQGGAGDEPSASTKRLKISFIADLNVTGSNTDIVVDSKGNIFYANVDQGRVEKVSPEGTISIFANYDYGGGYGTVAIDHNDFLYVAANMRISKISLEGAVTLFADTPGSIPFQMTVDHGGNLYYTEGDGSYNSTNIVKKIAPNGVISTFAGSRLAGFNNANGVAASFNNPRDLAVDSSGNLYITDMGNHVIRKITPMGDVSTLAGSGIEAVQDGVGTAASFYMRSDGTGYIAIDDSDNLYVADNSHYTGSIRKITPDGTVSNYCGNGSSPPPGVETGYCDQSSMYANMGLTVAPNGTIYYLAGPSLMAISE